MEKGQYEIIHDISKRITLLQVMDSVGNSNHAASILGYWKFDSN